MYLILNNVNVTIFIILFALQHLKKKCFTGDTGVEYFFLTGLSIFLTSLFRVEPVNTCFIWVFSAHLTIKQMFNINSHLTSKVQYLSKVSYSWASITNTRIRNVYSQLPTSGIPRLG